MLKNDIEKTLQAHCPEPPEGFAERMDNKAISLMQKKHNENKGRSRYRLAVLAAAVVLVLCFAIPASRNLIIRPDSIRARETATPLVMAFSEGHGEVTEGEGLSQEAREALEVNFPGVADKLKPVNLSCEKQGIRMKVISALAEGNESWVVYSLQDLEGDRINRFAESYVDLIGIGDNPGYSCYLEHNQAEHKVTCVYYEAYSEQNYPEDSSLTFEAADLGIEQELKIDLVPYLREYGKTSDGVKASDHATAFSRANGAISTDSLKVLDDSYPLNVNLQKDYYLTGIGWINDQLHVRIQDRQQEKITIGPMSVFPMKLAAAAYFPDQKDRECDVYHVEWSSGGNGYKDQAEYIFDIRPDEADKAELAAWGIEIVDVVRDIWEVQIPANSIRAGGSRHAEQPVENAPAQGTVPEETDKTEVSKAAEDLESEYSILKTRNELLEMKDKLVPVNLSCEDQGIRMEVEAAATEGREAWILYSLETTRDDLDQYHESIQFPNARWYNSMQYQKCEQRKVNVEGNKTTYLMNMEYAEPILPENGMVPVMLGNIRFMKYKDVDLTEIISEYADVSEGITPPEPVVENNFLPEWKHGKRIILDNSHPLDILLWEDVVLTGTGWINGELHIQLHYTDHTDHFLRAELRQYDTDSPYNGTDGYPYILDHYEQMWDGDGDGVVDGIEFTLDPEDDMEQRKIILHLEKTAKVVEGNWTVEFPLNDIRKEGDRFEQNGLMFRLEKDNTVTLVSDPSYQQKKEIAIPEIAIHYVREIGEDAFKDCKELEKISIPATISYIGDNAFAGCGKLVCSVYEGSYAQQYCEENGIPYEIRQGE